ncbi:hypothetical protein [Nostoc flagelliforme]|nr:hypothetical protein [Nostoc flagelliforme]
MLAALAQSRKALLEYLPKMPLCQKKFRQHFSTLGSQILMPRAGYAYAFATSETTFATSAIAAVYCVHPQATD